MLDSIKKPLVNSASWTVLINVAVAAIIMSFPTQARGAPQAAQMYRGDPQRTGCATCVCTLDPTLQWSYQTDSSCSATPVLTQNGTTIVSVYGGACGTMYAIAPDGSLSWSSPYENQETGGAAINTDGSIYFGTSSGGLHALTSNDSAEWSDSFRMGGLGINGGVMIGESGDICFGGSNGYVYSVKPDGALDWQCYIGPSITEGVAESDDGSALYVPGSDGCLYALNSNGTLKWKSSDVTANNICAVGDDGTVFVGGSNDKMYAFNPNGTLKWTYTTDSRITSGAAVDKEGNIYFGGLDGYLYSLNPNGTLRWTYSSGNAVYSAPTIDPNGTVLFGNLSGDLVALDQSGNQQWERVLGSAINTSPLIGNGGSVLVLDSDGDLTKFSGAAVAAYTEPSSLISLFGAVISLTGAVKFSKRRIARK